MTSKDLIRTTFKANENSENNVSLLRSKKQFNLMKWIDKEIFETHKKLSILRKELEIICEVQHKKSKANYNATSILKHSIQQKLDNSSRNGLKTKNLEHSNGNAATVPSRISPTFRKEENKQTNSLNREQLYREKVCQILSNQNKAHTKEETVLSQAHLLESLATKITDQLKPYIDDALQPRPLQANAKNKVFRSVAVETSLDKVCEESVDNTVTLLSLFDQTSYINLPDDYIKEGKKIKSLSPKEKDRNFSRSKMSCHNQSKCQDLPLELDIVMGYTAPSDDTIPPIPDSLLNGHLSSRSIWEVPSNSSTPKRDVAVRRHSNRSAPNSTSTPKVANDPPRVYSPPSFVTADASLSAMQYSELSALNSLDISMFDRNRFWKDLFINAQVQNNQ